MHQGREKDELLTYAFIVHYVVPFEAGAFIGPYGIFTILGADRCIGRTLIDICKRIERPD